MKVIREMGRGLLEGRKQTPSIGFCIEACAKLPKCEQGQLVAMLTRSSLAIAQVASAAVFLLLVLNIGTNVDSPDPMAPWIYWVKDGKSHELLGPDDVSAPQKLLELHGPFEEWPVVEDYWGGGYSGKLGDFCILRI